MAQQRSAREWLGSDDTANVKVGQGLIFKTGEDGSTDRMFLRSDENGNVIGYIAPNQDLEWKAIDSNDVTLGDTETFVIELTVDHEITADNGSFAFSTKLKNGSSARSDNVTFVLRNQDGTALASKMVMLDKGEEAFPATFYGEFQNDYAANTVFKVYAYSNNNTVCRGTLTPTGLKVIEARSAPVSSMATAEKPLIFDDGIGRRPTRSDIEGAIGASQQTELIKQNFTALGTNESQTRYWQVFFDHNHDAFFTHELYKAV